MKIVFTKPEMQEMIMKYLILMGMDASDKVLSISINNKNEDYLVVRMQDEVTDKDSEEEKS
jgi:hypothetical protein